MQLFIPLGQWQCNAGIANVPFTVLSKTFFILVVALFSFQPTGIIFHLRMKVSFFLNGTNHLTNRSTQS
jgi:hypothetical protein